MVDGDWIGENTDVDEAIELEEKMSTCGDGDVRLTIGDADCWVTETDGEELFVEVGWTFFGLTSNLTAIVIKINKLTFNMLCSALYSTDWWIHIIIS